MDVGMLEQDTLDATAEAILKMVRDHTAHALNPDNFEEIVGVLASAAETEIGSTPKQAAAAVVKRFGMSQSEGAKVLDRLLSSGDRTQYGVANAVTRVAQESESFERAVELEAAGGEIAFTPSDNFRVESAPGLTAKEVAKLVGA
jgi:precorrin-3B methylase